MALRNPVPQPRMSLQAENRPPLRVAVAGGGVGGLTTALAFTKAGYDVTVFEKTSKFARFGGPIQLASNALSTLKAIDEETFEKVMDKFTFTATRRCGIKDGLRSSGFKMSAIFDWAWFTNPQTSHDWFVSFPLKECADAFGLPYTGVVDRPDLQDILLQKVGVENGMRVVSYENRPDDVIVELENGDRRAFDLLVGADGIWSSVRATMYSETIKEQIGDKRQGCQYSGYTVFAGEAIMPLDDYYEVGYNVYIGPSKYFVKSDVGDGRVQWYAFCGMPRGTQFVKDTWDDESRLQSNKDDVIDYLLSLHDGWSPEIEDVLRRTSPDAVEQRDLYDRSPLQVAFRGWVDGRVCLLGDAVHPMMPNLGQGGCQAIEDAFELSAALRAYPSDVQRALASYQARRAPRVATVSFLSRLASDLIIHAFDTPWSMHDSKGVTWKSYLTFAWKPLLQLLIFPAQFLFLYSYHPTGSMGDLPKQLEAKWRARHRTNSQLAFANQNQDGDDQMQIPRASFLNAADDNVLPAAR